MSLTRAWNQVTGWLHARQLLASLLVAALVASPGYWLIEHQQAEQNRARCASGNELRHAVVELGTSIDTYVDDLLAAFGTTGGVDTSKLTPAQRAQYVTGVKRIIDSKKAFEDRLKAPAFGPKKC